MGVIMYKKQLYSGGSDIEPNPEDQATDELTKIGIEGTVYSVSGASAVSELADVKLTDLADGEILKYDATEEKWVNAEDSGSGGGSVVALPSLYSTKEKMVGLWTDNKPLYQKTIDFGQDITVGVWTTVMDVSTLFIDTLTNCISVQNSKSVSKIEYWIDGTTLKGNTLRESNQNDYVRYLTIQYTKTTDTPVEDFNLQDFGIFAPVIYSLEEREIGVAENGKPLYQKTIKSDLLAADSYTATGLTNIDTFHLISIKAIQSDGTQNAPLYISMYNYQGAGTYYGLIYLENNSLYYSNMSRTNKLYIEAVVQYTKTTDVPGSGQYTTLGVPAVHYSTDEQIIGTWIDGKPLYQKTVEANLSNGVIYTVTDGDMVLVNEAYGVYDVSGTIQFLNLNAYFTNSDNCMIYTRGSDIYSQVTNTFKTYYTKALLTIRYTKTTD